MDIYLMLILNRGYMKWMKWILLTDMSGNQIFVNVNNITEIKSENDGKETTIFFLDEGYEVVQESFSYVLNAIKEA